MHTVTDVSSQEMPAPENVRSQTRKLLASSLFASSPSLSRFLGYVVDETLAGRTGQLKEYAIGVSVLGRPEDYDPRLDPIVRVQARNLRNRLKTYYEGCGCDDPVIIDLPKGSYIPSFHWAAAAPVEPAIEAEPEPAAIPEPPAPVVAELTPVYAMLPPPPADRRLHWIGTAAACGIAAVFAGLWFEKPSPASPRPAVARTYKGDAQQLYARGRYLYNKHSDDGLRRSVGYFERSIAADPNFAPGYAGLAEAVNVLVQYGQIPPRDGMPRAKEAALKAIALDPNLPDAHVSLGAILEAYDWDFVAARREFRRAVELNPKHASARLWYGLFLWDQGDFEAAIPELEQAHQLDPVSVFTTASMASVETRRGNYDKALVLFNEVLELEPMSASAHLKLAMLYQKKSRVPESMQAMERARQLGSENPMTLAWMAASYQRWGMKEQARHMVEDLEKLAQRKYVSPFDLAMAYDATGDAERAIFYLEKAYEERSSGFAYFSKRKFHTVQSHPRFATLLSKAAHTS